MAVLNYLCYHGKRKLTGEDSFTIGQNRSAKTQNQTWNQLFKRKNLSDRNFQQRKVEISQETGSYRRLRYKVCSLDRAKRKRGIELGYS